MPGVIHYPEYREFEHWRVEANDHAMAALLGLRIAVEQIKSLESGVELRRLPEIFPGVPEIERLNVDPATAAQTFLDAERSLAYMAIPFQLAVYNAYLAKTLSLLQSVGVAQPTRSPSEMSFASLRAAFTQDLKTTTSADHEALLDWVQSLRNRIIHHGGIASARLMQSWKDLRPTAKAIWTRAAGSPPRLTAGQRADVGAGEIRATLAVTGRLAKDLNRDLARLVPRAVWARIAVDDFQRSHPGRWRPREPAFARTLMGHANARYRRLGFTSDELAGELGRRGEL